ncbi:MAG: hypothetical protein JO078_10095 [Candidatus Eremiobacteraeota bacterium]|nr:hypothetical protein [Candidatus Eremiobacteraeota bacterium]MBV9057263.1 hypothetical protein [Candidatus Eremiobacteraeota bacterium]MBV9700460.1 hypothetical protein [Candidatus Eremiobacteraeota bacterium]
MARSSSSVSAEVGWLALFLVVFAGCVFLFVRTLVPHHFNDKIAICLAALFAGLIWIVVRAWASRLRS